MGQVSSAPARSGATETSCKNYQWRCSDLDGVNQSTHEISVRPQRIQQIGLQQGALPNQSSSRRHAPRSGSRDAQPRSGSRDAQPDRRNRSSKRQESDLDMAEEDDEPKRPTESQHTQGKLYFRPTARPKFTGPQHAASSSLSGRASNGISIKGGDVNETILDIDAAAAVRAQEQNEWEDRERDKDMYLKRIRAQVGALTTTSEDTVGPLPEAPGKKNVCYSDSTYAEERSAKSKSTLSTFYSAVSGASGRLSPRGSHDPSDHSHSHGSRDGPRSTSTSRDIKEASRDRTRASGNSREHDRDREDRTDSRNSSRNHNHDRDRPSHSLNVHDRHRDDTSSGRGSRRSGSARSGSGSGSWFTGRSGSQARSGSSASTEARAHRKEPKSQISGGGSSSRGSEGTHSAPKRHSEGTAGDGRVPGTVIEGVAAKLEAAQRNLAEVQSKLENGDTRVRQGSEKMQAQVQARVDFLVQEAKKYDSKLHITSEDTSQMKSLLRMIQSEQEETLVLLRKAEKRNGEGERPSHVAMERYDLLEQNKKAANRKARELLSSVDTLLGKFSLDKDEHSSGAGSARSTPGSARSTVAVQLELMKIRESTLMLLKANGPEIEARQARGQNRSSKH